MTGTPEPTLCCECDHVTPRTRSMDGWRWRCARSPVQDIPHFLGPKVRATEPHGRCLDRNTMGRCPDWTPRRGEIADV